MSTIQSATPLSQNSTDFALMQQNFTNFIVTPANAFGLGGFVFDIEGETTILLSTEITDHYVEDNTVIQDHIAVRPQKVTLKGYVGELVHEVSAATTTPVEQVTQKLTTLNAYLPELSKAAQQIQPFLSLASQSFTSGSVLSLASDALRSPNLNNIVDLWALTKNLNPAASKQQQAYLYFKALMEQKILVSLQTPFEFVTNMAIESISSVQEESTRAISDFSITLKKIRTTSVQTVAFDPSQYQNRAQQQVQSTTQQGNNQGADVPLASSLYQWLGQ